MTVDKRRIDACLKACEGISTQNLEDNVPFLELARRYNVVLRERDALRAAQQLALEVLENVRGNINPERGYADELEADVERAIAAIAQPAPTIAEQDQINAEAAIRSIYGAQPAPSINEGVRKVTLDFRWESEAQHHIPTIEIEFDPVSPDSPNDAKGWQDRDRIAAMLTPEAKP